MRRIAEQALDHGQALEVMRAEILHRHADAAMQLHRLLPDEPAGAVDLHLHRRQRRRPLLRILMLDHHRGIERHRARLLERDQHVDRAVLQHLELADRRAELLARLEIVDRQPVQRLHDADRLRRQRRDGVLRRPARGSAGPAPPAPISASAPTPRRPRTAISAARPPSCVA